MTHLITRVIQAGFVLAILAVSTMVAAQENSTAVDKAKVATAEQAPYGAYLVDSAGWSVYLFKPDAGAKGSTCYGACAKVWPPVLTDGEPMVSGIAKAELLGTIERKNGATQVTYNGWPLYYFAKDDEPGDTTGQDVPGFGGEWYLLTPQGKPVHVENHETATQAEQS